jgi:Domain of unknown function (DU1801)
MSTNKTTATAVSVDGFIAAVSDTRRRDEAGILRELMERVSGEPATMWGPTMVGFGTHHYRYASGREGDTFVIGFSPRRPAVVLYGIWSEYEPEKYQLVEKLGTHTTGKGCVYVKRLSDVDLGVLEKMVGQAVAAHREA